ncbi:sensor histidine kinase [Labedella endophytica]|uniref:histidine kinase n=1 Tax=Labedella endophytica TaxID=1523160 RepID=A0A433JTR9_9MICO|nr:sensor histidine kinase [Labedella endophytica]RUR01610.1 sensor histidine kinase [Labedella endophytica]
MTAATAPLDTDDVAPEDLDPDDPRWRRPAPSQRALRTDIVLAVAFFVGTLFSLMLYRTAGYYEEPASMGVSIVWALVISLPLAFRRRFPCTVALVLSVAFIGGQFLQVPELLMSNITLFLGIYSVGAWVVDRRRAHLIRGLIVVSMFVWLLTAMFQQATDPDSLAGFSRAGAFSPLVAFLLINVLTNLLYFGGAWFFGDRALASARERALLEHRTRELELERSRTAAQAVSLERVRIARELHDVVAHHVSVMGVQAGAARMVMQSDPVAARDALSNVEINARSAIDELHGLLKTLREEDGRDADPAATSASTLGLESLPTLVDDSTAAGLPTTLDVVGEPRRVPAGVALNLYRIAQESLTNARKYGGSAAVADVRVRYLDDAVEVEVSNTGRATSGTPNPGGLGHVGMRERASASGGTIDIGRAGDGRYVVRARVPAPMAPRPASELPSTEAPHSIDSPVGSGSGDRS